MRLEHFIQWIAMEILPKIYLLKEDKAESYNFNNDLKDEWFRVAEFCVCVCPQSAIIVIYCINFLSGLIFSMCLVAYKKGVYRCLSLKVAHKIDCQNGFNFNKIHFDQLNHYFIDILFMRDAGGLASPPWLTHIINYISYFYTKHFLVKLK